VKSRLNCDLFCGGDNFYFLNIMNLGAAVASTPFGVRANTGDKKQG
jgi:hypothetical protein